jgi:hypothetical protein
VALVLAVRLVGRRVDDNAWIGTAPWRSATEFTPRLQFPFRAPSGTIQFPPTHLSPLGGSSVAYLATSTGSACPGTEYPCFFPVRQERITFGREVGVVDLANGEAPVVLAELDYATSIAPSRTPGAILFTRAFDNTVYERLPSGAIDVIATVPGFAVRDPALVGTRLASIVNGSVRTYTLPDSTIVQVAGAGNLVLTDLITGVSTVLATGSWQRPSLSSDARQLVAERSGDLYRFDLP